MTKTDIAGAWQPIETLTEADGEVLGYTPGCGYEVVRQTFIGVQAGAFDAGWVKFWMPLPPPPAHLEETSR